MTDRSKFEQMLEYLINEDQEKAKEIFHDIVVEKSREIYENLLADDFEEEDMEEGMEGEEDMEEAFGDDEEGDDMGGDASDDLVGDTEMGDEEGDEEGGEDEGDIEDRVMDLEDALDELKSEFEQLMAGDEGDDMGGMDDMGGDDMGGDDMGMDMDEPEDESFAFETSDEEDEESVEESLMREYVEKVGGATYDKFGKMGDNGVNTKSIVASKNDMGGTSANIAKSFSTEKGGTQGGLLKPTTTLQDGGNINKPGGNAGKTSFKKKEPGHGAEKKGKPEQADRGADSLLNGVKSRAK
jgi:hypothetical protein